MGRMSLLFGTGSRLDKASVGLRADGANPTYALSRYEMRLDQKFQYSLGMPLRLRQLRNEADSRMPHARSLFTEHQPAKAIDREF